ncbi:MAG: GTPase HflX, partial [Deltaproteobacteria bacterium]|nr:GTPase HflX [Deltaproteobacteria bacterium]
MIDTEQFLIPLQAKKALLVSDSDWGLDELEGLLTTMGGQAVERLKLPKRRIDAGTYMGSGKVEEIKRILEARELDLMLVDFDLSPSQIKNIEKIFGETIDEETGEKKRKLVLDRSGIILEIFNRHARTKEAKLQVEMARLEYLMPRLAHLWSHFERQSGSGGGALKGKGMGEKQIEVDRRLVKARMDTLKRRLKEAEHSHHLHRRSRESLLKVAIVGYTNAGKSTLLNALTHSEVLVEDALFATLDATVRLLNPKSRPAVLGIDTVGFIDRLPHGLVASFRSTLKEVLEADLLVHVLDASHPEVKRHFDVTMGVLAELLERGAKRADQVLRQIADEADGVGDDHFALAREAQPARSRIERGE